MIDYAILAAFAVLQVADGMTTLAILRRGGREMNPLVRALIAEMGEAEALIFAKALAIVLFVAVYSSLPIWLAVALVALYAGVTVWNLRVLRRL